MYSIFIPSRDSSEASTSTFTISTAQEKTTLLSNRAGWYIERLNYNQNNFTKLDNIFYIDIVHLAERSSLWPFSSLHINVEKLAALRMNNLLIRSWTVGLHVLLLLGVQIQWCWTVDVSKGLYKEKTLRQIKHSLPL